MRRWNAALAIVALALGVSLASGCGGSDKNDLFGGADDGGADGSAGTGGAGGSGGEDASVDGPDDGAGGGDAAEAGGGGADGGGDADGAGGGGGGGGMGGSTSCGGLPSCDDGIACTKDVCQADACLHVPLGDDEPGACKGTSWCDRTQGCVGQPTCGTDQDCVAAFAGDACKQAPKCDLSTSTCTFTWLDVDHDGHVTLACGGDDCDGSDPNVYPGATEICDGKDDDCDGSIDENATCPGLKQCTGGICACPVANTCGASCVDKATDPLNCGSCDNACPFGIPCTGGQCKCPASGQTCGGVCVDTDTSTSHCGSCGHACGPGYTCSGGQCACANTVCGNACLDTSADVHNCGACSKECPSGASCSNGQCNCPINQAACGAKCTDKKTDPNNCGACGTVCGGGRVCSNGTCSCPSGKSLCNGVCVDKESDPSNCGTCGTSCGAGACYLGQCQCETDFLLLVDISGSMGSAFSGGSQVKLDGERAAIGTFVNDAESSGFHFAVQYHPIETSTSIDSCTVADYAQPAVPFAQAPGVASAITGSLAARAWVGGSPTSVVLAGAADYARSWASSHPGHHVVIVLLADNDPPTSCTSTSASVTSAAQAAFGGTPSIPVYVVAVDSYDSTANWQAAAQAGGTGSYFAASSEAQILQYLRTIRDANKVCP